MKWLLKRLICKLRGHRFGPIDDGMKRRCARCGQEDWVMGNPYPKIGEPAHYWSTMWDGRP